MASVKGTKTEKNLLAAFASHLAVRRPVSLTIPTETLEKESGDECRGSGPGSGPSKQTSRQ